MNELDSCLKNANPKMVSWKRQSDENLLTEFLSKTSDKRQLETQWILTGVSQN